MKLSIIIPCYKEEKDIAKNVDIVLSYLKDNKIDAEVICVSDGSPDKTFEIISHIDGIKGIGYEVNRGKGGAVKYGIEHANGDYILYMDADLSTNLDAIKEVLKNVGKYDFIIGSRHHINSVIEVKQPWTRRFIGRMCRKIVNHKFHLKLNDTQCGFKAIRLDCANKIIEKQQIENFAFDVEYIYIAKLLNMSMVEIPVHWKDDRGSTVSPIKSSLKFFKDLKKIKKNKDYYLS